ncbi:MAG: class I SAM-dependent methyltransferase [Bacteroidales bacterium]|nr:class I SAM-dependent methyltransferase [Bacteroidales bacterium]
MDNLKTTAENELERFIAQLFAKNGPDKEEYQMIFDMVDQIPSGKINRFRTAMKPILNPNTIIGFSYTKPFGYNGDFFIIEKIYQQYVNPDKKYKKWDTYFHEFPAAIAVINRKALAIEIFEKLNKKSLGIKQNVMILGSGPVSETFEFFEKNPDSQLVFDMLDLDNRAIAYAKNKNKKYLKSMTFYNRNVIRHTPERKYDLIWSAGLFDYFKGKHFVYLLKKYYEFLNENGEMIIGNFNTENPSRRIMEILGDWFLYHRSEDELKGFALQAGIDEDKIEVFREPLGINLFLRVKK